MHRILSYNPGSRRLVRSSFRLFHSSPLTYFHTWRVRGGSKHNVGLFPDNLHSRIWSLKSWPTYHLSACMTSFNVRNIDLLPEVFRHRIPHHSLCSFFTLSFSLPSLSFPLFIVPAVLGAQAYILSDMLNSTQRPRIKEAFTTNHNVIISVKGYVRR